MRLLVFFLMYTLITSAATIDIIKNYTEPDEKYTIKDIVSGNDTYALVTVNGTDTLLINQSSDSLVLDVEDAESIFITQKAVATDVYMIKRNLLENFAKSFNDSRQPEENQCMIFTGTDKIACVDKDSCIKACYASPVCGPILGSVDFALAIRDWYLDTRMLDGNNSQFLQDLKPVMGTKSLDSELEKLQQMRSLADNITNNVIFTQYEICPQEMFNYTAIDSAINMIYLLKKDGVIVSASGKAVLLENETSRRIAFAETKEARFEDMVVRMDSKLADVGNKYRALEIKMQDPDLESKYTGLLDEEAEIKSLASRDLYRQAFGMENGFNFNIAIFNTSVDAGSLQYEKVLVLEENVSGKLARLRNISTADNITEFSGLLQGVNQTLSRRINRSDLGSLTSTLNNISNQIDIVASSPVSSKNDNSLPYAIALVLIIIAVYIAYVKKWYLHLLRRK